MSGESLDQIAALILGALTTGVAVGVYLGFWIAR